jgi:hypothetical protein
MEKHLPIVLIPVKTNQRLLNVSRKPASNRMPSGPTVPGRGSDALWSAEIYPCCNERHLEEPGL